MNFEFNNAVSMVATCSRAARTRFSAHRRSAALPSSFSACSGVIVGIRLHQDRGLINRFPQSRSRSDSDFHSGETLLSAPLGGR